MGFFLVRHSLKSQRKREKESERKYRDIKRINRVEIRDKGSDKVSNSGHLPTNPNQRIYLKTTHLQTRDTPKLTQARESIIK